MRTTQLYRDKLTESDRVAIDAIQEAAEGAPAKDKGLAIHLRSIEMLRAKGYSYRDIAIWFGEHGIKVNHVDVWRAHKNGLETQELFELAEHDEEWHEYLKKSVAGSSTTYEERNLDEKKATGTQAPPAKVGQAPAHQTARVRPRKPRKLKSR
jgi:hypothetical protein